jgi:phosphoenolpyruvate-protein kinase (PTS system EI component)
VSSSILHGIAASPGVVVGPAFVLHPEIVATDSASNPGSPDEEWTRWLAARQRVLDALSALVGHARTHVGSAQAEIVEAQREMAADPELEANVSDSIRDGSSAEQATRETSEAYATQLDALEDPYLRPRADDVREVARGLLQGLAGQTPFEIIRPPRGAVLCAETLTAAVLVRVDPSALGGIALSSGGATLHVAILAHTGCPRGPGVGGSPRRGRRRRNRGAEREHRSGVCQSA